MRKTGALHPYPAAPFKKKRENSRIHKLPSHSEAQARPNPPKNRKCRLLRIAPGGEGIAHNKAPRKPDTNSRMYAAAPHVYRTRVAWSAPHHTAPGEATKAARTASNNNPHH